MQDNSPPLCFCEMCVSEGPLTDDQMKLVLVWDLNHQWHFTRATKYPRLVSSKIGACWS